MLISPTVIWRLRARLTVNLSYELFVLAMQVLRIVSFSAVTCLNLMTLDSKGAFRCCCLRSTWYLGLLKNFAIGHLQLFNMMLSQYLLDGHLFSH